jgi:hypothetical protein
MNKIDKYLIEGVNWKNDPWKARDGLQAKLVDLGHKIVDIIQPSESLFFYDKNPKHVKAIGQQIQIIEKAVNDLESAINKASKIKIF